MVLRSELSAGRRRPGLRVGTALAAATVLLLAGCTAGPDGSADPTSGTGPAPQQPAADEPAADPMVAAQTGAEKAGADPEQIAVLADGVVTYDEYEQAMTRAITCMQDAGVVVAVDPPRQQNGTTIIRYQATATGAAQNDAVESCYVLHAQFVDVYWQIGSPEVVAFEERRSAALLPLLRDCLDAHDVDWAQDESFADLVSKSGSMPGDADQFNCMFDIGYTDWSG